MIKAIDTKQKMNYLSVTVVTDIDWHAHMLPGKWQAFKNAFIAASDKCAPFHMRRLKNRNNPRVDDNLVKIIHMGIHMSTKPKQNTTITK